VRLAGSAVATLTETVACGTDGTTPVEASTLPSVHEVDLDGGRYRFESTTLHGSGPVESAARSVREVAQGLTVAFPGHPDALTGIRLDHRGAHARADATAISWTTWHVYPGALPHVVTTSSTYTPLRRST
jgi:hypothetical protein